jgi:hypothetical protein
MVEARKLSPHDERRAAVRAGVDPRTVRAFLAGKRQRSTVAARVRATLAELGLLAAHDAGQRTAAPVASSPGEASAADISPGTADREIA